MERLLKPVFVITILCSAFLLFLTQPLYGKMILPLLGGAPAVWNTAMVFFQTCLLAGYAYAHFSLKALGFRWQSWLHGGLLLLALLFLPLALPEAWEPDGQRPPTLNVLHVLLLGVGLPFFMLSASAPLLQRWFSLTTHPQKDNPYFLYAASNSGSMAALLLFPFLLEPLLGTEQLSLLWAALYMLMVAGFLACRLLTRRLQACTASQAFASPDEASVSILPRTRLVWIGCALLPSAALLAVTNHITADVAAVPLLWVLPLALYLLSFIVVFSRARQWLNWPVLACVLSAMTVLVIAALFLPQLMPGTAVMVAVHYGWLFTVCLVGHYRLAERAPPPAHLTEFYLFLSLGGMLGGATVALLAPVLFDTILEYPLLIAASALLLPRAALTIRREYLGIGVGVTALVLLALFLFFYPGSGTAVRAALFALLLMITMGMFASLRKPLLYALVTAGGVAALPLARTGNTDVLLQERSFFGSMKVRVDKKQNVHLFSHGTTVHGAQYRAEGQRTVPATYYHRDGAHGQAMTAVQKTRGSGATVAVIGLGTGTMACLGRPQDTLAFYEIDPAVARIARTPALFSFLQDCPAQHSITLGDARLSLRSAPAAAFDALFVDAFSSDSIPVHLITREALALFRQKTAPRGLTVFHISNRFLNLRPVLASLAEDAGLVAMGYDKTVAASEGHRHNTTHLVVMAQADSPALALLAQNRDWQLLEAPRPPLLWRDDYSNILSVLKR